MREPEASVTVLPRLAASPALTIVLACALAGVVFFGLYPDPLVALTQHAILALK